MENTIGITLETGVGVQSAILHVCRKGKVLKEWYNDKWLFFSVFFPFCLFLWLSEISEALQNFWFSFFTNICHHFVKK